jgi:hypothetical protein
VISRTLRAPFRKPLVTVVVPVHDTADYLPDALASIEQQDTAAQVVVVDDGSTDGSGDIARRWAEHRPGALVVSQANAGPGAGAARNVGLGHAEGRYVLFLDSDDRLSPGGLDRLVDALEQTHDDLAVGIVQAFPERRSWPWDGVFAGQSQPRSAPVDEVPTLVHNPAPGNKLFRRKALLKQGLLFAEGIHHQDTYVSIPMLLAARRVTVVPDPVLEYRVRPGSVMSSHFDRQQNYFDHLQVVEHLSRLRSGLTPGRRHILDTFLVRSMQGFVLRGPQLPPDRADVFLHRAHEVYRQVDPQVLVDATRSPAHRRAYAAVLAKDPVTWAGAEQAHEVWANDGALYAGRPGADAAVPDPLQRLGAVIATVDRAVVRAERLELSGQVAVRGASAVASLPSLTVGLRLKGAAITVPATTHPEGADMSTGPNPPAEPLTRWVAVVDPAFLAAEVAPRLVLGTVTGPVSTRLRWDSAETSLTVPLGPVTITLQDTDRGPVLVSRPGVRPCRAICAGSPDSAAWPLAACSSTTMGSLRRPRRTVGSPSSRASAGSASTSSLPSAASSFSFPSLGRRMI